MTNCKSNESVICKFCEGYYDFGSEQPVCSSCHAFIYEFSLPQMTENRLFEEKRHPMIVGMRSQIKDQIYFQLVGVLVI
ncbi:unnamed protein product [Heterobilharzia americana]|nr:unnamed protein product [Heterobilharzia americana]